MDKDKPPMNFQTWEAFYRAMRACNQAKFIPVRELGEFTNRIYERPNTDDYQWWGGCLW